MPPYVHMDPKSLYNEEYGSRHRCLKTKEINKARSFQRDITHSEVTRAFILSDGASKCNAIQQRAIPRVLCSHRVSPQIEVLLCCTGQCIYDCPYCVSIDKEGTSLPHVIGHAEVTRSFILFDRASKCNTIQQRGKSSIAQLLCSSNLSTFPTVFICYTGQ